MARALPQATGLKLLQGLNSAKGLDLQFRPSVAIVAGSLDKLGLDIRSFKEPLTEAVRDVVIPSIRKNFDAGGRPRWEPLSEDTVRQRGGSATPILVRGGDLRRTMGYINIWTIKKTYATITDLPDNVWYGKAHQAGSSGGGKSVAVVNIGTGGRGQRRAVANVTQGGDGSIPARPFVMLQKSDERAIESVFRHWLDGRVRAAARRMR